MKSNAQEGKQMEKLCMLKKSITRSAFHRSSQRWSLISLDYICCDQNIKFRLFSSNLFHISCIANLTATTFNNTSNIEKDGMHSEVDQNSTVFLAEEEERLVAYLFENYDKNVRPVSHPGKNVSVTITPAIRQIIEVVSRKGEYCRYICMGSR